MKKALLQGLAVCAMKKTKIKGLCLGGVLAICCIPVALATASATAETAANDEITLTIDYQSYDKDALPVGKVGKTYGVFDCEATDGQGQEISDIVVYVFSPTNEILALDNNRFKTETEGQYTITYIAKQSSAYVKREVVITVDDEESPMFYEMDESVADTSTTGDWIFVADGAYGGGVGEIEVVRKVVYGGESVVLTEETASGFCFVPEKAGAYQIVYELTDFVGEVKTETKEITVTDSAYPILEEPNLASKYVLDSEVSLPIVHGTLYKNGVKYYLPVQVYYDEEEITDEMAFTADVEGEHTIRYVCENVLDPTIKAEYAYTVNVVNPDGENCIFSDYLSLENMFVNVDETSTEYALKTGASGDASMVFQSAIPTEFLSIGFSIAEEYKKYDSVNLVYTDSVHADERLVVRLGKLSQYGGVFYGILDVENKTLTSDTGEILANADYYVDGRCFEGFSSGRAYVGLQMEGLREEVVIALQYLASASVTTATRDKMSPLFLSNDQFKEVVVANYNQQITLPALQSFDLMDGTATVSLTVKAPDESVVYQGAALEGYVFVVDQYGEYNVEYIAKDSKNNRKKMIATIKVVDIIPPEIESVELKGEVKCGDTMKIPSVVATDNSATELLTYVYVSYGNFIKELVVDEYTFEEAGEYIFRYVAYDNNQNYSIVEYVVICK